MWRILLSLTLANIGETHRIEYIDCSNPSVLKEYSLSAACSTPTETIQPSETWTIAQTALVKERRGWHCSVTVSSFTYRCGIWGHLKTAQVPQILHHVPVSAQWCKSMVETRTFQPPSTTEVLPLVPERTNIFPVQTIGSLILSEEAITCTGQQLRINNLVISDILEISEFHVKITQVNLIIKDEKVEVDSDHLALPCKTNEETCLTGTGTYIWSQEPTSCQLERVREFQPVRSGSVFLDHQAKIVLNATDRVYLPACRNQEILATNLDGVFLIKNIDQVRVDQ